MRLLPCSITMLIVLMLCGAASAQSKAKSTESAAGGSAAEKVIRAETLAWFQAGKDKNPEKFASYYAPDANLFPPNEPLVSGTDNIRAYWKKVFAGPVLDFSGGPTHIEAARSGDIAYERGTYTLTTKDAQGTSQTQVGKYVVVWKKQPNGNWKAVADIFNPDK
jgi:uncharacterized protein (TIGR02246 family)